MKLYTDTIIFFYLTWSFIIWDFNPSNWTQDARVSFILLAVPLASLFSIIKQMDANTRREQMSNNKQKCRKFISYLRRKTNKI